MKKISMTLDPDSISRGIKEIQDYKKQLKERLNALTVTLVDEGVEIAKVQIASMDAIYTGDLQNSIEGAFDPSTGIGVIKAGAMYAVYVEFGTGVTGKGSPHPAPNGWKYDINDHGEAGWWYFNERDSKWHWTKDMKSRPFMYNTARELERRCMQIAKEVWGKS